MFVAASVYLPSSNSSYLHGQVRCSDAIKCKLDSIRLKVIPSFCTAQPVLCITLQHPIWWLFFQLVQKGQRRATFAELKLLFAIRMPQIGLQRPGVLSKNKEMKKIWVNRKSAVDFHFAAVEL